LAAEINAEGLKNPGLRWSFRDDFPNGPLGQGRSSGREYGGCVAHGEATFPDLDG
jgi:hypothetical protein